MQSHHFDENGWCRHCNQYDCDIIGALEATVRDLRERLAVAEGWKQDVIAVVEEVVYGRPRLDALVDLYCMAKEGEQHLTALTPDTSSEEAE